jgi:hypothetical protein
MTTTNYMNQLGVFSPTSPSNYYPFGQQTQSPGITGGMQSNPYNSLEELFKRTLGRTPTTEEIDAWNATFNINPKKPPEKLTTQQVTQFQEAAKPELLRMSQTPGFRPNQMMDQWYQPVYRPTYQNYAQPGYSLYGQADPTFSNMAASYLAQAMGSPYAQSNYGINMGMAQPYMASIPSYTTPNTGGITNLMGGFGQQGQMPAEAFGRVKGREGRDMLTNKFSSTGGKFSRALPTRGQGAIGQP